LLVILFIYLFTIYIFTYFLLGKGDLLYVAYTNLVNFSAKLLPIVPRSQKEHLRTKIVPKNHPKPQLTELLVLLPSQFPPPYESLATPTLSAKKKLPTRIRRSKKDIPRPPRIVTPKTKFQEKVRKSLSLALRIKNQALNL